MCKPLTDDELALVEQLRSVLWLRARPLTTEEHALLTRAYIINLKGQEQRGEIL